MAPTLNYKGFSIGTPFRQRDRQARPDLDEYRFICRESASDCARDLFFAYYTLSAHAEGARDLLEVGLNRLVPSTRPG